MRALLSALLVVFVAGFLPQPAAADSSADRDDIIRIISSQLDAFQRDDGVEAFSYASPGIRSIFGTPDRFMRMVIQGYMPVYRPQSVEFLELIETDGGPVQKVKLIDPNGRPVMAIYTMERQGDGTWRIAGCVLFQMDGRSA